MDDITLNLITFAAFLLIGGLVFFFVRRRQAQNEQELIQLAATKGWKYETVHEPLASGLRLSSPRWTLEAISSSSGRESGPGSSDVSASTTWRADAPGSTFLLGERTSQANLGEMGEMLTRQVLQLALGADANGLHEIQTGSPAFQQKYMLWAKDDELSIPSGIENILLGWKGRKPLIKRTSSGLVIELRDTHLKKAPDLMALVQLGESILGVVS